MTRDLIQLPIPNAPRHSTFGLQIGNFGQTLTQKPKIGLKFNTKLNHDEFRSRSSEFGSASKLREQDELQQIDSRSPGLLKLWVTTVG